MLTSCLGWNTGPGSFSECAFQLRERNKKNERCGLLEGSQRFAFVGRLSCRFVMMVIHAGDRVLGRLK